MATITSGSNATVSLNPGDTIAIDPQEKATARFENPTGTLQAQFNDRRTFGPYTTGRSVKITSVSGGLYYEVSTAKSAGSVPLSQELGLGVYWGTGAPTLSAAKGSLYLRADGSSATTRMYVNTDGATAWTNVATAT